MTFTKKTLVEYLNKYHGADYTKAKIKRDYIGGSTISLFRPGDHIPFIEDVVTPSVLAHDMGFRDGRINAAGEFEVDE